MHPRPKLKTKWDDPQSMASTRYFTDLSLAGRWARAYKGRVVESSPGMVWRVDYLRIGV